MRFTSRVLGGMGLFCGVCAGGRFCAGMVPVFAALAFAVAAVVAGAFCVRERSYEELGARTGCKGLDLSFREAVTCGIRDEVLDVFDARRRTSWVGVASFWLWRCGGNTVGGWCMVSVLGFGETVLVRLGKLGMEALWCVLLCTLLVMLGGVRAFGRWLQGRGGECRGRLEGGRVVCAD